MACEKPIERGFLSQTVIIDVSKSSESRHLHHCLPNLTGSTFRCFQNRMDARDVSMSPRLPLIAYNEKLLYGASGAVGSFYAFARAPDWVYV